MLKPSILSHSLSHLVSQTRENPKKIDEILDYYIAKTEEHQAQINSHIFFDKNFIYSQAKDIQRKISDNNDLSLAGVPVLVKDNIAVANIPMTCGSKILKNYIPCEDATVVKILKESGAIILGKTNLDEFAMGSSNEFSAYGAVKNPWNLEKVAGGSSGGSAAAVAADFAPVALGSDTGGSVRQPASFCGIVGLKPSYGTLSRYGLTAFASSLDQVGIFGQKTEDVAFLLKSLSQHDPKDSTSKKGSSFKGFLQASKMKVGIVEEFFQGASTDVVDAVNKAKDLFSSCGLEFEKISIPEAKFSVPVYYIIATAEASSNLSRYDGMRYGLRVDLPHSDLESVFAQSRATGFGEEVIRRIFLGTFVLSEGYSDQFYIKAIKARQKIFKSFKEAFSRFDALLGPTVPHVAFGLGEKQNNPVSMYASDICTVSANLAGCCGISIPCGFSSDKLPIGLQLMGDQGCEDKILSLAKKYQELSSWHKLVNYGIQNV